MTFNKYPLYRYNGEPSIKLDNIQKKAIQAFNKKVSSGTYKFVPNNCLCNQSNSNLDIIVSEKDRYGIKCTNILCMNCGLIRLDKKLDPKSLESFYINEYRPIYVSNNIGLDLFFKAQKKTGSIFYNLLSKTIDLNYINNVFEIGCGAGGILMPFKQNKINVSGCDFNKEYLKYGNKNNLNLYFGEINEQNTKPNSQDLIILSHVLEHVYNPISFIINLIKYVTPGKFILIEVPGIFYIHKIYYDPINYFQNAHVYNFYESYLVELFTKLGLKILYSDERATFILQKPSNWEENNLSSIDDQKLEKWASNIKRYLLRTRMTYLLKINPYIYLYHFKQIVKKLLK